LRLAPRLPEVPIFLAPEKKSGSTTTSINLWNGVDYEATTKKCAGCKNVKKFPRLNSDLSLNSPKESEDGEKEKK